MLGSYKGFPANAHRKTSFSTSVSNKRLQQALIQTFHRLNNETPMLEDVSYPSIPQCAVLYEFGIADAYDFNYLDEEEAKRVLKTIKRKPLQVMDFICVIRYYRIQNQKKIPLRFDYYMLRFAFAKRSTEIKIFHERGPRHMVPEDIIDFVVNRVNKTFSKKVLRAI